MQYQINIVNKHHGKEGRYIGRGSPLGNPFIIGKDGTREEVINKYKDYIKKKIYESDPRICMEISMICTEVMREGSTDLQCFCAPKACHGDVIKDICMTIINKKVIRHANDDIRKSTTDY